MRFEIIFMSPRFTNFIAAFLLIFVFFVSVLSMRDDSATMDEVAHLPAGYSYLTQQDMRLNPEHPPLIKDLAGLPLLFIKKINFPSQISSWQEDINGQWNFGFHFLYRSENPADKMIFWSRIPMILILILLGFYLFKWTRELFGERASLIALSLFSFSPSLLAHGRLVTTDVGAATGAFISTYYFVKFLKEPSNKNLIVAGFCLGIAQLIKFSLFLLFPFFFLLILIWAAIKASNLRSCLKIFGFYFWKFLVISFLFLLVVWPVYQYHVLHYPAERQFRDADFLLSSHPLQFLRKIITLATQNFFFRAYAQYFLGLAMVFQRAIAGHTTFFLGEVSAGGWYHYFPVVYIIKEPLTFHLLTIISLLYLSLLIKKPFWHCPFSRLFAWANTHFEELSMLFFLLIYWFSSLTSPLNIGVRHLLPVFPFTFVLLAGTINSWLKPPYLRLKYLFFAVLILWQALSVIQIYPHFLSYFNEIAGGAEKGYLYTVNSNLDWGQDLKRLKKWVEENKIEKIYINYFGGSDVEYYLKEKFLPWEETRNPQEMERPAYLAVSATYLQGGKGLPVPGFNQAWGYYLWLEEHQPVAKIGYSIFVYYLE